MLNMLTLVTTSWAQFASVASCTKGSFFGLVPWYKYLKLDAECRVVDFQLLGSNSSLLLIALAIIDDIMRIAGLVAVIFVLYGGFRYVSSQGSPDETAAAQKTILNAVIGLVIALLAVVIVSFIGNSLAVKS